MNSVTVENGLEVLKVLSLNASIINPHVKEALVDLIKTKPNIDELVFTQLAEAKDDLFIKHRSEILDSLKALFN
jgi:hypothetical protein